MKLIVGLGNPGQKYEETRHNVGFKFIDQFAEFNKIKIDKSKFNGLYNLITINDEKVMLLKPQSYMNLSGEVVKKYCQYFKINPEQILIINDDFDLPCGKLRIRYKGSSGGHNGLKNIEHHLGTDEYKRLKIGIGSDTKTENVDFVLSSFTQEEKEKLTLVYKQSSKIIEDYLKLNFENFMNKYN